MAYAQCRYVRCFVSQGIRRRDSKRLYAFDYGTNCSSSNMSVDANSLQDNSSQPMQQPASLLASYSSGAGASTSTPSSSIARTCNQRVYGQEVPPFYNMSAIATPLALFSGMQGNQTPAPRQQLPAYAHGIVQESLLC